MRTQTMLVNTVHLFGHWPRGFTASNAPVVCVVFTADRAVAVPAAKAVLGDRSEALPFSFFHARPKNMSLCIPADLQPAGSICAFYPVSCKGSLMSERPAITHFS